MTGRLRNSSKIKNKELSSLNKKFMGRRAAKKVKKGKKITKGARPIYHRAWGLASRLEHRRIKEKKK